MTTKLLLKQRSEIAFLKFFSSLKGQRSMCTSQTTQDDEEKERELKKIAESASIDEPPTTCCHSGCSNCVYIAWAEALTSRMNAGGPDVVKKVLELVDDPSLKAFLEMELRLRGIK